MNSSSPSSCNESHWFPFSFQSLTYPTKHAPIHDTTNWAKSYTMQTNVTFNNQIFDEKIKDDHMFISNTYCNDLDKSSYMHNVSTIAFINFLIVSQPSLDLVRCLVRTLHSKPQSPPFRLTSYKTGLFFLFFGKGPRVQVSHSLTCSQYLGWSLDIVFLWLFIL